MTFIHRILCALGLHHWTAWSEGTLLLSLVAQERRCTWCNLRDTHIS